MNAARVIVVGGAGALGRAACLTLAEHGAEVTVADLGDPGPVAAALPGTGHAGLTLDICDAEAVAAAFGEQTEYDGLVFAAGTNTTGPVSAIDWLDYERVMAVNLRGAFQVGAAISQNLRARPRPFAAVFYSSTAGLRGEYGASVYAATKFGLIGFVQCLAAEIAEFGGRANAICPGNVRSPMLHQLASEVASRSCRGIDQVLSEFAEASAFKRLIDPAEVAAAAAFLISPAASGISGQTLVVDGAPR